MCFQVPKMFTPNFTLHTGRIIPAIAFGTGTSYFERNDDVTEGIIKAFEAGFRYIDTAIMYQTEQGVGNAVKTLIKDRGFKREEFFITTKVNSQEYTYDKTMAAMKQSFEKLGLDYVDLVLIHSPGMPQGYKGDFSRFLSDDDIGKLPQTAETYQEARISMWEALQDLKYQGKIRDIGVSNFTSFHIEQLITNPRCREVPVLNQIEFNPYCVDQDILDYCQAKNILVQAYSPLGSDPGRNAAKNFTRVLENETMTRVAKARGCTVAQVAISWALSKGVSVSTKTEKPHRMKENLAGANVTLTKEDIEAIDKLNIVQRVFWNPYEIQ